MATLLQAPVPWTAVQLADPFWHARQRLVRDRTLPALYQQCRHSGRIDALRLGWRPGQHPVPHQFWDSDIAKWLEASAYALASAPDAALQAQVDEVIGLVRGAQQPDGYLNSYITNVDPAGRWADLRDGHELYCAGHLIEAGVAHFLATGSDALLEVVCRYADHIETVFGTGPGQRRGYCGHPEVELALVRLYRATAERRYLELSRYFVDQRGQEPYYFDLEAAGRTRPRASDSYYRRHGLRGQALRRYNQSHAPVREQQQVVGHAVRAMYLYSAMADLAAEADDGTLLAACQRLWGHLVSTRLYVTGGLGSSAHNEGFSNADYDLPNQTAYAESCAAVGLVLWAHRLLQLTGQGCYADVLERALYNAVAAALGTSGEHFFYANPLASDGSVHRQRWFEVACCPPNVARLVGSLGQYVYSVGAAHLAVHLFVRGTAEVSLGGQRVRVRQAHDYPWSGAIRITVEPAQAARFGVWLRVPGWSSGARLRLNGEPLPGEIRPGEYVRLDRCWAPGDAVELDLPMPVERIYAHPDVAPAVGQVALQRGPLVYCLEGTDHAVPLHRLALPRDASLQATYTPDLLGGVVRVQAAGLAAATDDWSAALYRRAQPPRREPSALVAVPYAVWDNRTSGQMQVWIRETDGHAPD